MERVNITFNSFQTHHDENLEGIAWMLFLYPAQKVIADNVDQTRAEVVFGFHHHVNAIRAQGGQPASKGLQRTSIYI